MAAVDGSALLARDVALDALQQRVGAAAQALQIAFDERGVLERDAVDLLRDALGGALGVSASIRPA